MKRRLCFWGGLSLYVVSFWLTAVEWPSAQAQLYAHNASKHPSIAGWTFDAFLTPLIFIHWHGSMGVEDLTIRNTSFFLNGWINPFFLLAVILMLLDKTPGLVRALRYVLVPMVAFCWITLFYQHAWPREGYLLWTIGMLLVLFSSGLQKRFTRETLTPRLNLF